MKDHILFDTTDATTITDSDKILSGMVSSSDGATLITDTTEGAKQGLDVYVINPNQDVNLQAGDGTDITQTGGALDINIASGTITLNSEHVEDTAHTTGDTGSFALAVRNDVEGTLVDTDGDYAPLQVDSSGRLRVVADIDVSALSEKNEDDAHSSGDTGSYILAVRQDTLASSTSADGDYGSFKTNAKGELYTIDTDGNALLTTIDGDTSAIAGDTAAMVVDLAAIEVELLDQGTTLDSILTDTTTIAGDTTSIDATLTAMSHTEDTAHTTGDQGSMTLAVRNDTLGTLVDTDGDYAPLQVNGSGELYVTLGAASVGVDDTANTAIANAVNPMTVANTAEDVVASPLANRKYLFAYNNGNKKTYFGATGVTSANGFPLSPGSVLELRAGAAIDIEWVAVDTSQEIRTLELS